MSIAVTDLMTTQTLFMFSSSAESRWQTANQTAAQRQTELETCADRLGSFASSANQLGPWLREKELMMSVLGPLSIDPNMLNTQRQQVQVRPVLSSLLCSGPAELEQVQSV